MATSLLALLDDIASVMDDVAVLTKVAAKKTSGVVGDDLALNAQQLTGITPDKELPIIWAVTKGSFKNKLILVPAALAITYFLPWALIPLLMIGGAFLCFEGVEKVYEKFFPHAPSTDRTAVVSEEDKIKGAIRTDFILSAEIIVISLGAMAESSLVSRIVALSFIAIVMTMGVYGLVAFIVKLDDIGLHLSLKANKGLKVLGLGLVNGTPYLMKTLGIVGTAAMFLVGGGIISHGIHFISEGISNAVKHLPASLHTVSVTMAEGLVGVIAGIILVFLVMQIKKLKLKK